jgi:thiamine thiazole synthase
VGLPAGQKDSKYILEDAHVHVKDEGNGYYSADSIEVTTKLCSAAIDAGVRIFNAISVEDVLLTNKEYL